MMRPLSKRCAASDARLRARASITLSFVWVGSAFVATIQSGAGEVDATVEQSFRQRPEQRKPVVFET